MLIWKSSNPTVATVDNGVVTAHLLGKTNITVNISDDETKIAMCTVEVKNNYDIWLEDANIENGGKYNSVQDVLSNTDSVKKLMASTNAVDYMLSNTEIFNEVIKNANAMTEMGNSSYALKTIKESEYTDRYCQLISNSDYWEFIYKKSIPLLTSDDSEYGKSTFSDNASYGKAYFAFDDVFGGTNVPCGSSDNFWVQFQFKNTGIIPKVALFYNDKDSGYGTTSTGYMSASIDGTNFEKIYEFTNLPVGQKNKLIINSTKEYKYFRCTLTQKNNNYSNSNKYRIEFNVYGL